MEHDAARELLPDRLRDAVGGLVGEQRRHRVADLGLDRRPAAYEGEVVGEGEPPPQLGEPQASVLPVEGPTSRPAGPGSWASGEFCFTLTMTDVATEWRVNRSVPNKAAIWVVEAIDHASECFPFPILGIDSDNGAEFINAHLFEYCLAEKITFTRGRPSNNNDGSHAEQMNWTHGSELVGYLRFDADAELKILNRVWELDWGFTNLLHTQQKLDSCERVGPKVIKRHDDPVRAGGARRGAQPSPARRSHPGPELDAPGELQREIARLCGRLEDPAPSKAPAAQRRVNRAFDSSEPELSGEATNQRSRTI